MVEVIQVECLEAIIDAKSFRAAAHQIGLSQPAVSGYITRLERELRLPLLERSTSGSHLTAEGVRMLPMLRAYVESAESIRRASSYLRGRTRQTLTILANSRTARAFFPNSVVLLRESFGNLVVRIDDADDERIIAAVAGGTADIGILMRDSDVRPPVGLTEDVLLAIGAIGMCGPADSPLLHDAGVVDASAFRGEPLVLLSSRQRTALADAMFPHSERGFVCIVDDTDMAVSLVERGAGYAMIGPTSRVAGNPELAWRGLRNAPQSAMTLLTNANLPMSPAAAALTDLIRSWGRRLSTSCGIDLDGVAGDTPFTMK